MKEINLLIADDHPLFRIGVKQTLEQLNDVKIHEVENGNDALKIINEIDPEIAVLDLRMPEKTGLEILSELYNSELTTKVILLTMYKNTNYFYQAISLGAKGYLLKETAVDELITAVEKVNKGGTFVSSRLKEIIDSEKSDEFENKLLIDSIKSLTESEKEIMKLVSEWKTNSEIAEILSNSIRTIENHRARISEKLNLRGVHALTKFAIENREFFQ